MSADKPLAARTILVHLGGGIGNIVLATPLLWALARLGFRVDLLLAADYAGTRELLRPWSAVRDIFLDGDLARLAPRYDYIVPANPPFYAGRLMGASAGLGRKLARPADALFYRDEQEFYLSFARQLGYADESPPEVCLPISAAPPEGITAETVILAPGCKTGLMAAKRWPHFPELASSFENVAIVGTGDDLRQRDGTPLVFPAHARSLVDRLTLRQTAETMAGAGVVIANDSGLAHVAAAVGVPTLILFGPTPDRSLGPFPRNVTTLRLGLACEPCWFGARFVACGSRITCLAGMEVRAVVAEIRRQGLGCSWLARASAEPHPAD
jgi:hypothetical protein